MKDYSNLKRVEGRNKVTGKALFIDDLSFPDMLHGITVRSPISRGILKKIHFDANINWNEFVVVTAKDIPGQNIIHLIKEDWPFLVEEKINHKGEAIVLLAHADREKLQIASTKISFEIEPLPAVFTIDDSINKKEIIWGEDNCFKKFYINKGNVDSVFQDAYHVLEQTYQTLHQEQLYIEPQGAIATFDESAGVTVWGSLQCPYYVHGAITNLFNLPDQKVRIIQSETGGAFGGKEDYPSMIAGHTALLAYKAKKPVKIVYKRAEDLQVTTKRHPSKTTIKTAVDDNGKLLAMDIEFLLDGGAYATLSEVVLSRGTLHAAGPYFCENIRIKSQVVATNSPPNGAFRGFGAPQSIFAMERHLDNVAQSIGISPVKIRKINFIKTGQTTATNQVLDEKLDFDSLLSTTLSKLKKENKKSKHPHIKSGTGIATFMHGAGFTGSGEKYLASIAGVEAMDDGKIKILCACTEMGQGRNTIFAQVVSETLGIDPQNILTPNPDTKEAPNSGPTVASRTSMIVGKLLEHAANGLKNTLIVSGLLPQKYLEADLIQAIKKYKKKYGTLKSFHQYKQPEHIKWDDQTYQGDAYPTFAWACYGAQVSVNTLTYEVKIDNFVATQEVGRVLNLKLAQGQIEGGVAQGIGFAIFEKAIFKDGVMVNNNFTNYIMPTALDLPRIQVYFKEWNKEYGPGGAKGIGELPLDGSGPAVINAIADALGICPDTMPYLPEDLMRDMEF